MYICVVNATGALSVMDSDDDYCVSYNVTMVDAHSCTRRCRIPHQQQISEPVRMCKLPRSPDPTHISECTGISRQPMSSGSLASSNIGDFCHQYVSSIIYVYNVMVNE